MFNSHAISLFVEERESAFQFHYQQQLNDSNTEETSELLNPSSSSRNMDRTVELPSGLKTYYSLAQSLFEKRVTRIEKGLYN